MCENNLYSEHRQCCRLCYHIQVSPLVLNWFISIMLRQTTVVNIISNVSRGRRIQMMKMMGMTRSWGCRNWRLPCKPCSSRGQLPWVTHPSCCCCRQDTCYFCVYGTAEDNIWLHKSRVMLISICNNICFKLSN